MVAAFVVAGVSATAIGVAARHLARRLRGSTAIPIRGGLWSSVGQDERSLLEAGWAHQKSNCNGNAIALFDQALVLNPDSLEALKGRGICYSEIGEYNLAMQNFHRWVLRAPESGDAFFHRGGIWRKLDLVGLAISDYRYALRFSPSNAAARDALVELERNSAADCPKSNLSLAALFALEVRVEDSPPSNPGPTAGADQPTAGGLHG